MEFIVARVDKWALIYDSDDVETIETSTPFDLIDVTPPDAVTMHQTLGAAHLHLHLKFKPGAQARWIEGK